MRIFFAFWDISLIHGIEISCFLKSFCELVNCFVNNAFIFFVLQLFGSLEYVLDNFYDRSFELVYRIDELILFIRFLIT